MSDPIYFLSLYVLLAYASVMGALLIIWQFKHEERVELEQETI